MNIVGTVSKIKQHSHKNPFFNLFFHQDLLASKLMSNCTTKLPPMHNESEFSLPHPLTSSKCIDHSFITVNKLTIQLLFDEV